MDFPAGRQRKMKYRIPQWWEKTFVSLAEGKI
jgi:hypothetical protein